MRKIWVLLILTAFAFQVNAQQKKITGKVIDESGITLPGVNVLVKGTTRGVITGSDGTYSILAADNESLLFSFIGYNSIEEQINGRSQINVSLQPTAQALDEVVVVGYGEMRKRDVTGSMTKVTESENIARQYPTVDMLLQGRASGVQVTSNSGSPGSAVSVRIRGTNSLRGNNEPLYVIDGIIINSAGEDVANASSDANEIQSAQNGLTGLNPRDIENIEILKDASATAIYGSRGANGVVMITTKKGVEGYGKAKVDLYGSVELSWLSKKIDILDGEKYAMYQNEGAKIEGTAPKYKISGEEIYPITYDAAGNEIVGTTPLNNIDWQDEIYEMGVTHNEGVTVSGANKGTNYYFSAGYSDQKGIVQTSEIQRGDLRLNLIKDLSDKFKLDTRLSLMFQNGSFAQGDSKSGGNRSFTKQVLSYPPLVGEGSEGSDLDLDVSNPYAWLTDYDDLTKELRGNASVSLMYDITKAFSYQVRTGLDYRSKDRSRWWGLGVFKGQKENGTVATSTLDRYSYVIDNLLTYKKKFNKIHQLNATGGVTFDGSQMKNSIYEVSDFPVKTLRSDAPQLGQVITQPLNYYLSEESILSFIGRVNYSLKDKYVLTASFRADGSSKFSEGNKFGYFPSTAFAWRLGEEKFIKDLGVVNDLKLRVGWGITGNQAISAYSTMRTYDAVYYVDAGNNSIIGNIASRIANPDLTWETTSQFNTGIDFSLFKGRISGVVDLYYKETDDLLQEIRLGPSNGFATMPINRGEIENRGLEISLDGEVIKKNDLTLNTGVHISFNRNKVIYLGLDESTIYQNGEALQRVYYEGSSVSTGNYFKQSANVFMEGQPVGMFWGYQTNGIYKTQAEATAGPTLNGTPNKAGDVILVDHSGNGNVSDEDKTFIGNPNPDFIFGFNFSLQYKRLTFSALFDGVFGNDVANGSLMELSYAENLPKNILNETYDNAWRSDGSSTGSFPRIGYRSGQFFSDRIVEDGSYMRLNNLSLGYDIPTKFLGMSKVNVYATGRNLWMMTKYKGYDPQVTSFMYDGSIMGVDWLGMPSAKTFLVGVNITF